MPLLGTFLNITLIPLSKVQICPPESGSGETVFILSLPDGFLRVRVSLLLILYVRILPADHAAEKFSSTSRPDTANESALHSTVRFFDLSSSANVTGNYLAFLDLLDEMIGEMDGAPTCLMGNTRMMAKIRACARRATMYQTGVDGWGRQIEYYGAVPLIDLGTKAGTNSPIVATSEAGETSLYAVRMGLDGFHGVSVSGQSPIRTWLPDFSTAGAVKKGEVEMVAAVALKSSKAAAVMRGLKVM